MTECAIDGRKINGLGRFFELKDGRICESCGRKVGFVYGSSFASEHAADYTVAQVVALIDSNQVIKAKNDSSVKANKPVNQKDSKAKFCYKCGAEINTDADFCPHCGAEQLVQKSSVATSTSNNNRDIVVLLLTFGWVTAVVGLFLPLFSIVGIILGSLTIQRKRNVAGIFLIIFSCISLYLGITGFGYGFFYAITRG